MIRYIESSYPIGRKRTREFGMCSVLRLADGGWNGSSHWANPPQPKQPPAEPNPDYYPPTEPSHPAFVRDTSDRQHRPNKVRTARLRVLSRKVGVGSVVRFGKGTGVVVSLPPREGRNPQIAGVLTERGSTVEVRYSRLRLVRLSGGTFGEFFGDTPVKSGAFYTTPLIGEDGKIVRGKYTPAIAQTMQATPDNLRTILTDRSLWLMLWLRLYGYARRSGRGRRRTVHNPDGSKDVRFSGGTRALVNVHTLAHYVQSTLTRLHARSGRVSLNTTLPDLFAYCLAVGYSAAKTMIRTETEHNAIYYSGSVRLSARQKAHGATPLTRVQARSKYKASVRDDITRTDARLDHAESEDAVRALSARLTEQDQYILGQLAKGHPVFRIPNTSRQEVRSALVRIRRTWAAMH